MLVANSIKSLAMGQYFFRGFRQSLHVQAGIGQLVYTHSLSLAHEERNKVGSGAIVSFMQVDAAKMGDAIPYMHLIWSGPLQLIIAVSMLYNYLGYAGLVSIVVMILMMPLNTLVGKKLGKFTLLKMKASDKRVKFTMELLQARPRDARMHAPACTHAVHVSYDGAAAGAHTGTGPRPTTTWAASEHGASRAYVCDGARPHRSTPP